MSGAIYSVRRQTVVRHSIRVERVLSKGVMGWIEWTVIVAVFGQSGVGGLTLRKEHGVDPELNVVCRCLKHTT